MKNLKRMLYLKFARMNKQSPSVPVPSIISENTQVKGDIISNGIIHIDGRVEGDVTCDELVIGIKGAVIGSVNVTNLHLYGVLQGKATVDKLFVSKTAKLLGDATHNSIAIEPGAYIDGHCMRAGAPIPAEQSKPDLMITDASKNKK
ncbi:MAG: polymer-forming cytoskeletal protein [Alphaproteobacteria bacterium]|nr:polymer-forming cytoskeletal protein [Alphaproteobacteria bacterium]